MGLINGGARCIAAAVEHQVFDEIGILPQHRCGDPLIVGRINGPNYCSCCFVIAWWLDMEAL